MPKVIMYLKSPSGMIHYVREDYGGGSGMQTFCSEYICGGNWKIVDGPSSDDRICKKCRVAKRGTGTRGIYRPMTRRLRR